MLSLIISAFFALPGLVLGGVVVFVFMRYLRGGKQGVSPVRVNPGEAAKLFEAAIAGNKPMMIEALRKAFELDLQNMPLNGVITEWAVDDIRKRLGDASHPAYVIEAIAKFTGLTPAEVFAIVKEDFTPKRATPVAPAPAVAVTAALLLFVLPSIAWSASPVSSWGMPVTGPQRFYERDAVLRADPPLRRDRQGQLIPIGDCNLPDKGPTIYIDYFYADWCTDCAESSLLAENLRTKGYDVLKYNAATDSGAKMARAYGVKSVPFWVVKEDGRHVVTTNDQKKVLAYLNAKQQRMHHVAFGPTIDYQAPSDTYLQTVYDQPQQRVGLLPRAGRLIARPIRFLGRLFRRRC